MPKKGSIKVWGKYWEPAGSTFVRRLEKTKSPCPRCGQLVTCIRVARIRWDNVREEWVELPEAFEYYCPRCGYILTPY